MAPVAKRSRTKTSDSRSPRKKGKDAESSDDEVIVDNAEAESSEEDMDEDGDGSSASGSSSTDTETEINRAQSAKSKKTAKRKRRATSPTPFGQTLEALLSTSVPGGTQAGAPLALKPSLSRRKNEEKLELKAKRVLEVERREREEKSHVQDVIGGWNNDDERSLRKVAQRGVVQLFNTIQQAQLASAASVEETKKLRGTGKPTLSSLKPADFDKKGGKDKKAANKSKDASAGIDKNSFLNMIRAGGVVRNS
ncbi:Rrp15p domain-containing protein [Ceratobasidium sp. AG-Ba]|nr:Rrp15p domain-containing protein [Ceratobasidium sp. AG-Ba]